jgi:hypothetical protein
LQVGVQYSTAYTFLTVDPYSVVTFYEYSCSSNPSASTITYSFIPPQGSVSPQTFQITSIDYANNLISGELTSLVYNAQNSSDIATIECIFTNVPFQQIEN